MNAKDFSNRPKWHVVHVLSRTEKKVAERLDNQGITTYLPVQRQLRQWSDRKKWVDMVLVSGYIFVKILDSEQLEVLQTPGVSRFLKHGGKNVFIADLEMQRFRDFVEKAAAQPIEFTAERLSAGTPITIKTGNFKGFSGEVVVYKNKRNLSVRLEHIGHFLVTLSAEDVERL